MIRIWNWKTLFNIKLEPLKRFKNEIAPILLTISALNHQLSIIIFICF